MPGARIQGGNARRTDCTQIRAGGMACARSSHPIVPSSTALAHWLLPSQITMSTTASPPIHHIPVGVPSVHDRASLARGVLLGCGILSSLLYVAMNVFVAMQWEGYSSASQTVSELSAVGAPTRSLWVVLAIGYTLLVTAFGWGIWTSARGNRPLRVVGGLMIAYGLTGLVWPFAPMHLREVLAAGGGTWTDTLHIVLAMVTVPLMLVAIGVGAAALGKRFRYYSIASLAILLAFGLLTGRDGPRVGANLPTPWVGVWERILIGVYLLWVVVLAIALLRGARDRRSV